MNAPASRRPRRPRSIEVEGVSHGNAPIPMGARVGNSLYSSGIFGLDPQSGTLPADADAQARFMFAHLRSLLANAGGSLDDVVYVKAYVADNAYRAALNAQWVEAFPDPHDRPARHTLLQALPPGMLLQIEIVAVIQDD